MAKKQKELPADAAFYRGAFRWMSVGLEFCLVISLFAFGGYWLGKLDRQDTSTAGMVLGFFVGFGVMMYILVKRAKQTERDLKKGESQDDDGTSQ